MIIRILSGLALGLLLVGATNAECVYPKEPTNTPDGATATQDQMVEGMKSVKEYNNQVTAYQARLEQAKTPRGEPARRAPRGRQQGARAGAAGPDARAEQIDQINAIHPKRHNAAVEALEQNAARF